MLYKFEILKYYSLLKTLKTFAIIYHKNYTIKNLKFYN
jgi:hypothetical protein